MRFSPLLFPGLVLAILALGCQTLDAAEEDEVAALKQEVARHGWFVFSAHPAEIRAGRVIEAVDERGPLDLYVSRPDGSQRRNVTRTDQYHEYGARFSPDGSRMLFRRLAKDKQVNHDLWGAFGQLVIADADGSRPVVQGAVGDYPWASWSPDGKQIACLFRKEGRIRIYDLQTKRPVKELSSYRIYQQLFWSPDGKRLCGTANVAGRQWNVVSIDLASGKLIPLSRALSCTPDWFQADAERVIYSNRNPALFPGQYNNYGLTMLMQATADGKSRKLIYGAAGRHCYFGCTSPDDKYVVFADEPRDTIVVGEMRVLRLADTPILPPGMERLKLLYPHAKPGPVLSLKLPSGAPLRGFEPDWTYAKIGEPR